MSVILNPIIFILSFIVVISVLVFFHELGHYSVARLFNVRVDRFSIGFGKPVFRRVAKSGTEWVVSRWPIGGYVKFWGDDGAASNPDAEHLQEIRAELTAEGEAEHLSDCFHFKPLWQRALIVLAGPVANFILAIVFFAIIGMGRGEVVVTSVVQQVLPDSAAEQAGVQAGDRFLTLDGHDVRTADKFVPLIALSSGEQLDAIVARGDQEVALSLTPRRQSRKDAIGGTNDIGTVGVVIGGPENYMERKYGPIGAIGYGARETWNTLAMTGRYVRRIFQGKENGDALGGPVRILTMTGKSATDTIALEIPTGQRLKLLFWRLLSLAAALSVGLGVANLMPIPALDGGHLLYYGYEALAGRPLSEEKQEFGFRIGFALLITALVFLTLNDAGYILSMNS